MEFDSPYDFVSLEKAPQSVSLSLEELDSILELDVVDTVPPPLNSTVN
jgi:hypothetical protein